MVTSSAQIRCDSIKCGFTSSADANGSRSLHPRSFGELHKPGLLNLFRSRLMFLSRLVLNSHDPQVRCDLARPYEMHRTLWRAFPDGDPGRVLFRVDTDRTGAPPVILVQSDFRPDWQRLAERPSRYLLAPPDLKEFQPSFILNQR